MRVLQNNFMHLGTEYTYISNEVYLFFEKRKKVKIEKAKNLTVASFKPILKRYKFNVNLCMMIMMMIGWCVYVRVHKIFSLFFFIFKNKLNNENKKESMKQ